MQKSSAYVLANEQMLAEDRGMSRCQVRLVHGISYFCPLGSSAAERLQPADFST